MLYLLILAVSINGTPMLFPYSPQGEPFLFADRAACLEKLVTEKERIAQKGREFQMRCLTQKAWDDIPAQFDEIPSQFQPDGDGV